MTPEFATQTLGRTTPTWTTRVHRRRTSKGTSRTSQAWRPLHPARLLLLRRKGKHGDPSSLHPLWGIFPPTEEPLDSRSCVDSRPVDIQRVKRHMPYRTPGGRSRAARHKWPCQGSATRVSGTSGVLVQASEVWLQVGLCSGLSL